MDSIPMNSENPIVNLHAWQAHSRANGPGIRYVLWFQGCDLGCSGCFNPTTHKIGKTDAPQDSETPTRAFVTDIFERIAAHADEIEGITISGGEPFQQPDALLVLLSLVRENTDLSVIVFSGYTKDELQLRPYGPRILALIDVLIDGRYEAKQRQASQLRGSTNQQLHLLTSRYSMKELDATPVAEVHIDPQGNITMSGVQPIGSIR